MSMVLSSAILFLSILYPSSPYRLHPGLLPMGEGMFDTSVSVCILMSLCFSLHVLRTFVVNRVSVLLQNPLQEFLYWLRIEKTDHLILTSRGPLAIRQHVVLCNVDTHGIRCFHFLDVHHLLPKRLSLPRQIPIDKQLGRIRMRRAIDERQHTAATATDGATLL